MPKKNKPQPRETVTVEEAAKMLGISKRTIFRLLSSRDLEGRKRTLAWNSTIEIYVDSIERYDRKRQIPPLE